MNEAGLQVEAIIVLSKRFGVKLVALIGLMELLLWPQTVLNAKASKGSFEFGEGW